MTAIESAIRLFNEIILTGVPYLLQQNETAFLSFMCSLAGIDALGGYRFRDQDAGIRFKKFVLEYFPSAYHQHADNLWILRCRILHNFSPAHFALTHASAQRHLEASEHGAILSDDAFFNDLRAAAIKFFDQVQNDPVRQEDMNKRLADIDRGGTIYTATLR
jgi:hypothetical protein